ncbi:MAG: MBL fold metallo-hydrolase [Anaerolineaceae bacterium]
MEITWYGHSCFKISERGKATIVTDPFNHQLVGYSPLNLTADIVTISHDKPGHNYAEAIQGDPYVINGPGEYEIRGVFITGIQTNGHAQPTEDEPLNTLYLIDFENIQIAHLGGLNRVPTQTEIEAFGPVHIALVPIGGESTLTAAKAAEVISLLEPEIVIPMHYATPESKKALDPLSKFLKEMGIGEIGTSSSFKIANARSLPEEMQIIILDYQHA